MSITLNMKDQCPFCGANVDAVATMDPRERSAPEPDDFTVCFACSEVCIFGADRRLRKPTEAEEIELKQELAKVSRDWVKLTRAH